MVPYIACPEAPGTSRRRRRARAIALVSLFTTLVLPACVSDAADEAEPPAEPEIPRHSVPPGFDCNNLDALFMTCGLGPKPANVTLECEPADPMKGCAVTAPSATTGKPIISLRPDACDDANICCTLKHELVHAPHVQAITDACTDAGAIGTAAWVQCVNCTQLSYQNASESAAYCSTIDYCNQNAPGGGDGWTKPTGSEQHPRPPDDEEYCSKFCKALLDNPNGSVPGDECQGSIAVLPETAIPKPSDLCPCGSGDDFKTNGCGLSCPNGKECRQKGDEEACSCQDEDPCGGACHTDPGPDIDLTRIPDDCLLDPATFLEARRAAPSQAR